MNEKERTILLEAYGVIEWIVGEGKVLPNPYPDPDDIYLQLGDLLGVDQDYIDLI